MPRTKIYESDKPNTEAVKEYKKNNKIKRVPLDMREDDLEALKKFAASHGETLNGFIKTAIKERVDRLFSGDK